MKAFIAAVILFGSGVAYGQGFVPRSTPLFNHQVSLSTYSSKGFHYYKPTETPFDKGTPSLAYCTPGHQPVFCAIESKLSKTFNFPVKVRLDDRKYDFR